MRSFVGRDILSLKDIERHEFERIFEVAKKLAPIAQNRKNVDLLKEKTLVTAFYQPSTRTRLAHEAAMLRLGGKVTGFSEDQVYCTSVDLDQYELTGQEQNRLGELASEIVGQPLLSWPEEAENIRNLSNENQTLVSRLDSIFWEEIPKMGIGKILSDVNPVGGFEKARAIKDSLKRTGLTLSEVLYVGDSITDVQALELVKNAEGVAISFNGNRYSIKAAKWACMCGNTAIIGAIARLLTLNGMETMDELMADLDSDQVEGTGFLDALASMGVGPAFLEPLRLLRDKDVPRLFLVNSSNISDVIKDSEYMRKNVRGLSVGELG